MAEEQFMQKKYQTDEKNFYQLSHKFQEIMKDKIRNHTDLVRSIKSQLENKLHLDDIFMKSEQQIESSAIMMKDKLRNYELSREIKQQNQTNINNSASFNLNLSKIKIEQSPQGLAQSPASRKHTDEKSLYEANNLKTVDNLKIVEILKQLLKIRNLDDLFSCKKFKEFKEEKEKTQELNAGVLFQESKLKDVQTAHSESKRHYDMLQQVKQQGYFSGSAQETEGPEDLEDKVKNEVQYQIHDRTREYQKALRAQAKLKGIALKIIIIYNTLKDKLSQFMENKEDMNEIEQIKFSNVIDFFLVSPIQQILEKIKEKFPQEDFEKFMKGDYDFNEIYQKLLPIPKRVQLFENMSLRESRMASVK